jgi:peptidylprolyl isomerase
MDQQRLQAVQRHHRSGHEVVGLAPRLTLIWRFANNPEMRSFDLKSVISNRMLLVAGIFALLVLTACQAAGKNPDNVQIPVIEPTPDPSLCLNDNYPADAPAFADVSPDQLVGGEDAIRIFDRVTGSGATPTINDLVTVEYTGWLEDGCIFDSSHARGEESDLILVALIPIPGWREAMLTMAAGGTRRIEIPPSLAYQEVGSPPVIPGDATLTYEVKLITVLTPADASATATVVSATATAEAPEGGPIVSCDNPGYPDSAPQFEDVTDDQYSDEPSGIRVFDTKVGDGDTPNSNSEVSVHYTGWFAADGCVFDSSYSRGGASVSFPVGGVIPGFGNAILGMQVGGQRRVFIPSEQGYGAGGAAGAIPPNSDLVFDIVLESIQ